MPFCHHPNYLEEGKKNTIIAYVEATMLMVHFETNIRDIHRATQVQPSKSINHLVQYSTTKPLRVCKVPSLSYAKLKGVFISPQIPETLQNGDFESSLHEK